MYVNMDKEMIVVRFLTFKNFDFIEEHSDVLKKNKIVWMLKTGKYIPAPVLDEIINNGGMMILKAPKKLGGKYYMTHFCEYYHGNAKESMVFPEYYYQLPTEYDKSPLDGTWLKIDRIHELTNEYVHRLRLCSNGKRIDEVVKQTRTSVMYVYLDN